MMYYNNDDIAWTIFKWIFFIMILGILLLSIYSCHLSYGDERDYIGYTVTDKAVKNSGKGGIYLVYTKDENGEVMVFSVEDLFWEGRFDASDDYAKIEIGKTYNFHTIGIRKHFWSSYPNIISMTETN